MTEFKDAKKQIEQMTIDKKILRYLIDDVHFVGSKEYDDPIGCRYICVKPGMYDDVMGVSNIDFVQEIYAQNGISLKKHVTNFRDKQEEVLVITFSDMKKLSDIQHEFLDSTAPYNHEYGSSRSGTGDRSTEIINLIFHRQRKAEMQGEITR